MLGVNVFETCGCVEAFGNLAEALRIHPFLVVLQEKVLGGVELLVESLLSPV